MAIFISFELCCWFITNNFKCLSSRETQNNTWNHDSQEFLALLVFSCCYCLLFSLTVQFHFFSLLPLLLLQSIPHYLFFFFSLRLFSFLLMPFFIPAVCLLMNWLGDFFSECCRLICSAQPAIIGMFSSTSCWMPMIICKKIPFYFMFYLD